MNEEQLLVKYFHKKFGFTINETPSFYDDNIQDERLGILREEVDEYESALKSRDIVKVADALGDILYVLYGTCVAHGIDIVPVFLEIHRSNMTKESPGRIGKAVKGANYSPPDIKSLSQFASVEPALKMSPEEVKENKDMREKLVEAMIKADEEFVRSKLDPNAEYVCCVCKIKIKGFENYMRHFGGHYQLTLKQLHRRFTI